MKLEPTSPPRPTPGTEDPIKFDLPSIEGGHGKLITDIVAMAATDIRKWCERKVAGRESTLAAAIGLAWLRGDIESRLTFDDWCNWGGADVDRTREMILSQCSPGRLRALMDVPVYEMVLAGTVKHCRHK